MNCSFIQANVARYSNAHFSIYEKHSLYHYVLYFISAIKNWEIHQGYFSRI